MTLKYNRRITPRPVGTSKGGAVSYGELDPYRRSSKELGTLTGNIQKLRWWWRYLRLAVECEEKDILVGDTTITTDKDFYKDWGLEKICFGSFDDWFNSHRELFTEPAVTLDTPNNPDEYVRLYIPRDRFTTDVLEDLKPILEKELKGRNLKFQPSGKKVPLVRLHMRYNILVMKFNGERNAVIKDWVNEKYADIPLAIQSGRKEVFVHTKDSEGLEKMSFGDKDTHPVMSHEQGVTVHLRKGRNQLHDVARGVFP